MSSSKEEIEYRIKNFQQKIKSQKLEAALVFSPLNIFYFTNTFVKGVLLVSNKETKLFVHRPLERAKKESFIPCEYLPHLKSLSECLKKLNIFNIGIECKSFDIEGFNKIKKIFDNISIKCIDNLILEERMIKTPYEINCVIEAGKRLNQALRKALPQFKPGMKEIEASAIIEKELRLRGHPGWIRSFWGFEIPYGYLISGKEALEPVHFITGEGGKGICGFPGGATNKKIKKKDPILIDFSGYFKGYYIDQTRMASFEKIPEAEEFYQIALKILKTLEKETKPGIRAEEIYEKSLYIVQKNGFKKYFMNHGGGVKFIGHGVGLQIDEPPTIGQNQKIELKENMIIALEPKFHVPDLGVIGLEDTYLITKNGLKRLTKTPRKWILLK